MKMVKKRYCIILVVLMGLFQTFSANAGYTDQVILEDYFNNYESLEDMYANCWAQGEFGTDAAFSKDGNEAYVTMSGNATSLKYQFDDVISQPEKLRITTTVRMQPDVYGLLELVPSKLTYSAEAGEEQALGLIALCMHDGKMYAQSFQNKYCLGSFIPNQWYGVSVIADLKKGTYHIQVSYQDNIVGQYRDLPMVILGEATNGQVNDLKSIRYRCWNGSFDIAGLTVASIEKENERDTVMVSENFENVTMENFSALHIIPTNEEKSFSFDKPDVGETKSVILEERDSGIVKEFPVISTGRYKVTYSVYLSGTNIMIEALPNSWTGDGMNLAFVSAEGGVYHTGSWNFDENFVARGTLNTWITIENILDIDAKTNTYTVRDASGRQLGNSVVVSGFQDIAASTSLSEISCFRIRNWGDVPAYVDDFCLAYDYGQPQLTEERVTVKDCFGNAIADFSAEISPAINEIVLNFGAELDEESLVGAVCLIDENGESVPFNDSLNKGKYSLKINSLLKNNTTYTLRVSSGVSNKNHDSMSTPFVFSFTTGKAEFLVEEARVTMDDKEIEALDEVKPNDEVTVHTNLVNASDRTINLNWVIGYYHENRLIKAENRTARAEPGAIDVGVQNFTVLDDLEGITEIKFFLWDTKGGMMPYSETITLK